ncbi:exopolyphosphatase [Planctomycetota bacterium]
MTTTDTYRLVTRSDFDGLVSAVLLKDLGMVDEIKFVHPKDMQDGKVEITGRDITTNLPYVEGVHLAFDHHASEYDRLKDSMPDSFVVVPQADSAARVVYDHFGGKEKFPGISEEMLAAVDKGDSARFERNEILNPRGWVLLHCIMDARTGLGRFRDFRISNYKLMMDLIDYCKDHTIEEILELPDVKERVDLYFSHQDKFKEQVERCVTVHGNLVVLDLRQEEVIYAGNRFTIYALFPDCNISIHVIWGLRKQNTVFAMGKSIFNRTSNTNVGKLCAANGGGGHRNAGTCQVDNDKADESLKEIVAAITTDG